MSTQELEKSEKELEEVYNDDPEEEPAGEYITEQLGVNPDELFNEEENADRKV